MVEFVSIVITLPTEEVAQEIAVDLVESNLIACAQIEGPIKSIYQWDGDIKKDSEWRLVLKSVSRNFSRIEQTVLKLHPYDVPQIIALPIHEGHKPYLNWIEECIAKSSLKQ